MSAVEAKNTWTLLLPEVTQPSDQQWNLWLCLHDPKIVSQGITQLAAKYRRMNGQMDAAFITKFASSVMNRLTRERQPEAQGGAQ